MPFKIYKSASDGTLGKQEFLKELRTRLIQKKIEVEEVEKILNEYYEWNPREEQKKNTNSRIWVIDSMGKKRSIEELQRENINLNYVKK